MTQPSSHFLAIRCRAMLTLPRVRALEAGDALLLSARTPRMAAGGDAITMRAPPACALPLVIEGGAPSFVTLRRGGGGCDDNDDDGGGDGDGRGVGGGDDNDGSRCDDGSDGFTDDANRGGGGGCWYLRGVCEAGVGRSGDARMLGNSFLWTDALCSDDWWWL